MSDPNIVCKHCGYRETLNKRFIFKILGGAFAGGGFWAWVAYFFAGTGLALPICVALVVGGVAIAAFSNEIAAWISSRYSCPNCGRKNWKIEDLG